MTGEKNLTIVVPCYNEQDNVNELYRRIKLTLASVQNIHWKILFIDNDSIDSTVENIRSIAAADDRVGAIVNSRNFGHIRSPYYALMTASGDAVVIMAADLQDPPELLSEFIDKWVNGFQVVLGIKKTSEESRFMFWLRGVYYRVLNNLSASEVIHGFHGYALLDRKVIENIRAFKTPEPYLRGLIVEVGFARTLIEYHQPLRKKGVSKNNFFTLIDLALLGLVTHSRVPLRLGILCGAVLSSLSLIIGLIYLVLKLLFWDQFSLGIAPLVIGFFMFSSIQLLFLGLIGEYLGAVLTQVRERPLVVERERINC